MRVVWALKVYLIAMLDFFFFTFMNSIQNSVVQEALTNFSCKGPDRKYFRFVGHVVFVATITHSQYSRKAAMENL